MGGRKKHEKQWQCDTCQQSFTSKMRLTEHSQTHRRKKFNPEPPSFDCPICGKTYASRRGLRRHRKRMHNGATTPNRSDEVMPNPMRPLYTNEHFSAPSRSNTTETIQGHQESRRHDSNATREDQFNSMEAFCPFSGPLANMATRRDTPVWPQYQGQNLPLSGQGHYQSYSPDLADNERCTPPTGNRGVLDLSRRQNTLPTDSAQGQMPTSPQPGPSSAGQFYPTSSSSSPGEEQEDNGDTSNSANRRKGRIAEHSSESQRKFKCSLCNATFPTHQARSGHERKIHGRYKPAGPSTPFSFLCSTCGKIYGTKENLRKHERKKHKIRTIPTSCESRREEVARSSKPTTNTGIAAPLRNDTTGRPSTSQLTNEVVASSTGSWSGGCYQSYSPEVEALERCTPPTGNRGMLEVSRRQNTLPTDSAQGQMPMSPQPGPSSAGQFYPISSFSSESQNVNRQNAGATSRTILPTQRLFEELLSSPRSPLPDDPVQLYFRGQEQFLRETVIRPNPYYVQPPTQGRSSPEERRNSQPLHHNQPEIRDRFSPHSSQVDPYPQYIRWRHVSATQAANTERLPEARGAPLQKDSVSDDSAKDMNPK